MRNFSLSPRAFVPSLALLAACYDPAGVDTTVADSSDTGSSSSPSTSSPTEPSTSSPTSTEPTSTSPTTTSSPTSTDPSETDPSTGEPTTGEPTTGEPTGDTTGAPAVCGDGSADFGELCLPDDPEIFNVGAGAFDVALADIDGAALDIITLNRSAATASVLRNDGVGGLGNAESHTIGDDSCRIRAVDGDGDGDIDLVTSGDPIVTLVNDGTGDFDRNDAPFSAGGFGGCSDVHDLDTLQNNGGPIDIVYSGEYNNTFAVGVAPAGGWTFGNNPISVNNAGEGSSGVTVTQLAWDGDAYPDVVTLNKYSDTASVWRGNGSGGFTAGATFTPCVAIDSGVRLGATGDLDSDGEIDIVTTCVDGGQNSADAFAISFGNGDGSYDAPIVIDSNGAVRPLVVDVNADDYPDILIASDIDFGVAVFVNDGAGTFADPIALVIGEPVYSMAVGDIEDDGAVDIVVPYDTPMGGRVALFRADP